MHAEFPQVAVSVMVDIVHSQLSNVRKLLEAQDARVIVVYLQDVAHIVDVELIQTRVAVAVFPGVLVDIFMVTKLALKFRLSSDKQSEFVKADDFFLGRQWITPDNAVDDSNDLVSVFVLDQTVDIFHVALLFSDDRRFFLSLAKNLLYLSYLWVCIRCSRLHKRPVQGTQRSGRLNFRHLHKCRLRLITEVALGIGAEQLVFELP